MIKLATILSEINASGQKLVRGDNSNKLKKKLSILQSKFPLWTFKLIKHVGTMDQYTLAHYGHNVTDSEADMVRKMIDNLYD